MTVCIATICTLPNRILGIVGMSDRMLTAGDVEFEPPQQKVYSLAPRAPRAAILVAGNIPAQISICDAVGPQLPEIEGTEDTEIRIIADVYATEYIKYRQRESETVILSPLGLTLESFLSRQKDMAPDQVQRLTNELRRYDFDPEAIICGVDARGPHIFTVHNPGVVQCHDPIAFAAIGIGARHAESQFMFSRYVRDWPLSHALLLSYSAKRRAEAAPGVGTGTDVLFIEPLGQGIIAVSDAIRRKLDRIYRKTVRREETTADAARVEIDGFINSILNPAPPEVPTVPTISPPTTPPGGDV